MPWKNKELKHAYYLRNAADAKRRAREWFKTNKVKTTAFIRAAKDVPCKDCGNRYPHYVMDFDHVRGLKDMSVAAGLARGWSIERLQREIDKCEVVCANCHRIRSFSVDESKRRLPKSHKG